MVNITGKFGISNQSISSTLLKVCSSNDLVINANDYWFFELFERIRSSQHFKTEVAV